MNLDAPLELVVSHLPPPPKGLHYTGTIDTYNSIPGIYVAVSQGEYTLFGSFIPFADLYFLQHPVDPNETGIYYDFVDNGVVEIPMNAQEIKNQVEVTIKELAQTFQAFFNIFVPLTGTDDDHRR